MREKFIEFQSVKVDLMNLKSDTVVVFDANTLLHIYRYSKKASQQLINVMKSIEENIWIPYQVALEFHRNRQSVKWGIVQEKKKINEGILELISNKKMEIFEIFKTYGIRSVDSIKVREKILNDLNKTINKNIQESLNEYLNLIDTEVDPLDEVLNLFNDKVGDPFTQEELNKIIEEGEVRYKNNIPPGFKDVTKKGVIIHGENYKIESKYGDLVFWKEIIKHSKNMNFNNVIIVSDDMKEDWIYETKGIKIGPRVELIKELMEEANCRLSIINTNKFIELTSGKAEKIIIENYEKQFKILRNNGLLKIEKENSNQVRLNILNHILDIKKDLTKSYSFLIGMGIKPPELISEFNANLNMFEEKVTNTNDLMELINLQDDLYMYIKNYNEIKKDFIEIFE